MSGSMDILWEPPCLRTILRTLRIILGTILWTLDFRTISDSGRSSGHDWRAQSRTEGSTEEGWEISTSHREQGLGSMIASVDQDDQDVDMWTCGSWTR